MQRPGLGKSGWGDRPFVGLGPATPQAEWLGKEEAPQGTIPPSPAREREEGGAFSEPRGRGPQSRPPTSWPAPGREGSVLEGPLDEAGVGMSSQAGSLARWPSRPGPGGVSGGILAPQTGVGRTPALGPPTSSQETPGGSRRLGSEASGLCGSVTLVKSFLHTGPLVCL